MSLLGIDVGTTGCKAAAFTPDGGCLAAAYREYAVLPSRQGRAELDSARVLALVWEAIAEVAAQTTADPITALCVSSMGEAMTPVSRDRRVLGPCILSSDTRGGEYIEALRAQVGDEELYHINPNIPGPNYALPKLCWLRDHQPELYHAADYFLLWGDLVTFMLGCPPVTSHSLANRTLLYDIRAEDWSDRLLALTGISREKLPASRPGGTVAGMVADVVADDLGLPRGVQVVVGGHDQCCNALGAGITRVGGAVCGIGTFECITPTYDAIPPAAAMRKYGLNVEHHVLPGLYVSFIYNQGGALLRWFRATFAAADARLHPAGVDLYTELTNEMLAEPSRLFTLPYFEMTGPPRFLPDPSGAIIGLKMHTTRGEILKSVLEGETFYFVESLQALAEQGIDTTEFIATGGGAKSDAWLQLKADIFGIPFTRPRVTEAGTLGAAMLAGLGIGIYPNADTAAEACVRRDRTFIPDADRNRQYQERYEEYRRLVEMLVG